MITITKKIDEYLLSVSPRSIVEKLYQTLDRLIPQVFNVNLSPLHGGLEILMKHFLVFYVLLLFFDEDDANKIKIKSTK